MGRALLIAAGVVTLAVGATGTGMVTSVDDGSCGACHLHRRLLGEVNRVPPETLAGRHGARRVACIACHRGHGAADLLLTELVAGRDTVRWGLGQAREPHGLSVPRLAEASCRRCHGAREQDGEFHGMRPHGLDMPLACMTCHHAHVGAAPAARAAEGWERGCTACHAPTARITDRYLTDRGRRTGQ
jgi:hypothetical protein